MNNTRKKTSLSIINVDLIRTFKMMVTAIILMTICLSAVSPITPVASSSPEHYSGSRQMEEVNVCINPIIYVDTTWTAGNIYLADCIVTVNAGVTLTVEAGAVVRFGDSNRGLKVLGTLNVTGAEDNPAVFTSLDDDPTKNWYGIVLYQDSAANLNHAHIRYAGSGSCVQDFADSLYNNCYNRSQLDVRMGNLVMNNSEIRNGGKDGITLQTPGLSPSIKNTRIANNSNSDSGDKIGFAITQTTINMQPAYANLSFDGNDFNQVGIVIAELNQDVSLGGAPMRFYIGSNLNIPSGRTLTVQPGTDLDFTLVNATFTVLAGGTLLIQGNQSQPVTIKDVGIEVSFGGMANMSYAYFDGGNRIYYGLYDRADGVTIDHCKFHNFTMHGIYAVAGAGQSIHLEATDIELADNLKNGMYISNNGSGGIFDMTWIGGRITGNNENGINVTYGPASLTLKDLIISANGQNGLISSGNNNSLYLDNVQISTNTNESISWNCNGSITAKDLSLSGNGRDALAMAGCTVTSGREWDLGEAGVPVVVTNNISVESGGVLSIAPGTRLGFEASKSLAVRPGGALYALGTTDEPIVFSRAYETQSGNDAWLGLTNLRGTMILRHCEVAYCNFDSQSAGITAGADSATPVTNTIIQNCKIHDNGVGIKAYAPSSPTTTIVYNEFHDNATHAVRNIGFGEEAINAYHNYWGDPTGPYHATLNPGGLGDPVGDKVNFDPFLTTPPEESTLVGEMWVSSAGPNLISPGEVNDYAIQYLNLTADPILDAIAVIQLPLAGNYISSTNGGTYWPARHQVFWVLGDIAPGTQGMLTARVRFDWGLPRSYTDGSYTVLAGSNYQSEALDFDEYLNFDKDELDNIVSIDISVIPTNPAYNTLYAEALADGFEFREAYQNFFESGKVTYLVAMRTPDKRTARFINLDENGYTTASTTDGNTFYSIHDLNGGQHSNLLTLESTLWGSWADPQGTNSIVAECNYARCMRNCYMKKISNEIIKDAAKGVAVWLFAIPAVGGIAGVIWGVYETADMANEIYMCHESCTINPLTGCCNAGEIIWSPSTMMGNTSCSKYVCNASSLSYSPTPNSTDPCGYGNRCVAGYGSKGGCKPCIEDFKLSVGLIGPEMLVESGCQSGTLNGVKRKLNRCSEMGIRVAKDPNAIYGPLGDVLPEQEMDYRITCENEGDGDAYGVYIINELPEQLDESTLVINNGGVYLSDERQIVWYIGELAPKGEEGSEAEVTYSARLKPGLATGTAVVNQAIVYFPSVPEETPTNTWVNVIYPLAATPMQLETDYMTPLEITLEGRPAGSLTFKLESLPISGTLEGELPNLTYTPMESFSGTDFFTFTVSLDAETSQLAQVTIEVSASGDETSPSVLWVTPEDQQTDVDYSTSPIFNIPEGDVYAPVITAKLSERVQEETITSSNVSVMEVGGAVIPSKASFDPATNLLTIKLLSPLTGMRSYLVTLTTGITDLNGNALNEEFSWQFFTSIKNGVFLPLIIK